MELNHDDLVRRSVIMALMCHFEVSKQAIETDYRIDFDDYFSAELGSMTQFAEAGLVEDTLERLTVTPKGWLLVRAVAMRFDRYLTSDDQRARQYSRIL